jgi:hypothetical protein
MNRRTLPLLAFSLLLLAGCASTSGRDPDWPVGEWRFRQTFSTPTQADVLTGTVRFQRDGRRYTGQIRFDLLQKWENLEEVYAGDSSIRWYRPDYPESFQGTRTEQGGLKGYWSTWPGTFMDGHWEAERP